MMDGVLLRTFTLFLGLHMTFRKNLELLTVTRSFVVLKIEKTGQMSAAGSGSMSFRNICTATQNNNLKNFIYV